MNHEEVAVSACVDHLERKTRFTPEDLKVGLDHSETVRFQIEAKATVSYKVSSAVFPGRTNAGLHDIAVHSIGQRDAAILNKAKAALGRANLIADVRPRFAALRPENLPHQLEIETLSGQIVLTTQCRACSGAGYVSCSHCGAVGTVVHSACGGKGYVTRTISKSYTINGKTQYRTETHREACHCQNGRQTCARCRGAGRLGCDPCGSTGQQTEISTLALVVGIGLSMPRLDCSMQGLESLIRDNLTIRDLAAEGLNISYVWADKGHLESTGKFEMTTQACRLEFKFDDTVVRPVVIGSSPKILELDGLAERLVAEDMETLDELLSSNSPAKARRAGLKNFVESEIHRDMIDHASKGKKPSEISRSLQGALAPKYVASALSTLLDAGRWERSRATAQAWVVSAGSIGAILGVAFIQSQIHAWPPYALPIVIAVGLGLVPVVGGSIGPIIAGRRLDKIGGPSFKRYVTKADFHKIQMPQSIAEVFASATAMLGGGMAGLLGSTTIPLLG